MKNKVPKNEMIAIMIDNRRHPSFGSFFVQYHADASEPTNTTGEMKINSVISTNGKPKKSELKYG